jgi:hypothetical protein
LAAIWIVSESSPLLATLAHHVEPLGEVWSGRPERADFKAAPNPDLLILCGAVDSIRHEALERMLAFVREIPQPRRAAPPVLYLAADTESRSAARLERLFDDRHLAQLHFPFDPDELQERARDLLDANTLPVGMRERARQAWVTREVERLYAGVDLPALRQAIDPRNAHRPVLLLGEPGTRRGLLARYVHNLAEPARDVLVPVVLQAVGAGELERAIMTRTVGRRATVYLDGIERAGAALEEELAHLLGASGALALEPLRWIAAATRASALDRSLRELTWLRVELPPLRARPDKGALIDACVRAAAERQGRELVLEPAARERLLEYGWPGNLRELELVAEASCAAASGSSIAPADLRIAGRAPRVEAPLATEVALETEPVREDERAGEPERVVTAEPELLASSDEDLMLATLEASEAPLPGELLDDQSPEISDEELLELEELEPEWEPVPPATMTEPSPAQPALLSRDLVLPLARTIRGPLRAVRTYASLVEQRPEDVQVRRELCALIERDLGGLDDSLQRVERFARLGVPVPRPFDLASVLGAELDARQPLARANSLVVLRELDALAPPLLADKNQVRLAAGALLDLALRLVPPGGDLYLGSAWRPGMEGRAGGHRILLRFHSPEDVLTGPGGEADGEYLEVVMARELFARAGATFAVDASGAQDNVILVELPG